MRTKELCAFIVEREKVRINKEKPDFPATKAYTKDPILLRFRFCNVHREDDKVTKWITKYWREPYADDPDLWFAMVVARLFNQPDTLAAIGFPVPYKPERIRKLLHDRRDAGLRNFNGAYIVSTNGHAMDKVDYLIHHVMGPAWARRKALRPDKAYDLQTYHTTLMEVPGLASFMAGQVVADLKYVRPLLQAPDWHTWAASGPGSRRGLNRVCAFLPKQNWKEATWLETLQLLQDATNVRLRAAGMQPLHAQDLQNCLCEFDKYERVRLGEGVPKQLYRWES